MALTDTDAAGAGVGLCWDEGGPAWHRGTELGLQGSAEELGAPRAFIP